MGHLYLLTINKEVSASLAQQDKNALARATERSYRALGAVMNQSFEVQQDNLRKAGASVRTLTADEVQRWATVTRYEDGQTAWANDQKTKGVHGIDDVMTEVREIMVKSIR